ncbi:MAG: anaerobic ribonucleoside-triphosphate reductase activating protein [Clostridia bacterium]|nr:anaerobic ribonucleoside-triphosphate reductase activating protein [Oscillospiraceae bacterium]MBQ7960231.1 anaerobic ribonucleoside-triphosphate reductase activating protein [Clostridia bacterium]
MKIGGLMKMTLLDFPGRIACTVFLEGCNFRCPFCHNSQLVDLCSSDRMSEEEFFTFLSKRSGLLDGVCVSGGEPLLSDEIFEFLRKIKDMGYSLKLDTNGSFPKRLERAVDEGLCDYVAMDIKNSPEKYGLTAGCEGVSFETVKESIELLKSSDIPHEFRTTVVKGFHTAEDIGKIAEIIGGEEKYFLQPFRDGETVLCQGLKEFDTEEIKLLLAAARELAPKTEVRGIEL